jgi:hypothetical protein
MTRTLPSRLVAIASILVLTGACNSPAPSVLSDPRQILAAAATNAATATTVHVDLTADGSVSLDLTGSGTSGAAGAPIKLTGTTAAADLDLAKKATRATFSIPGLLGLAGELIVVDGAAYYKTTLTGAQYRKQAGATTVPAPSVDPSAIPAMIGQLNDFLAKPGVDPVKGADVDCGGKTCSTVRIELTPAELAALNGGSTTVPLPSALPVPVPVNLAGASLDLTFQVERDTNRFAGLAAIIGLGDGGKVTANVVLSKWNEPVTITAPPADQIAP